MTLDWWLTYLLTTLILSLSPGSGAINTMSTASAMVPVGLLLPLAGYNWVWRCISSWLASVLVPWSLNPYWHLKY